MTKDKEELDRQIQRCRDYLITFTSDHGKRVLEDLMEIYEPNSFLQAKGDPYCTAFNEGCRNVVLEIKRHIEMGRDPGKFFRQEEEE